ncbi:CBS domain-containing protein [Haloplasma contractile]|uniref:CBS domain containing protein n=1 Tax=Haloplasma contractile SSD-17B TaxID=1033810 RepID=U2FLN5_9MOLU|nr:CBS domain-containing protein [Haloplasma contractile]ERJ12099.1 CBS domain containing protein [Haloplasma contractile SSD-17B]
MRGSNKFLKIYNDIDNYMRRTLEAGPRMSHIALIDKLSKKSNVFRFYKHDLKEFAELRNAIIHNTHFSNNQYGDVIAEPHRYIVEMYEELYKKIMRPKLAKHVFRTINDSSVYTATRHTKIIDIIKNMHDKEYTCVPILENNKLIGVFSENVLLTFIAKHGSYNFEHKSIDDILELTDINNHNGEYFEFVKIKDTVFDIKETFSRQRKDRKRLEMVFVTGNGTLNEDVLGVISAWDLI